MTTGAEGRDADIEENTIHTDVHVTTSRSAGDDATSAEDAGMTVVVRPAILELMKYGLLEESSKPNLYRNALLYRDQVDQVLSWLDLGMRIDDIRGLAFIVVTAAPDLEDGDWSHPLVRKQRLTLDQSLLVAILRQQFVAHEVESGVGASDARVALEDLLPHLQAYLGDLGSHHYGRRLIRSRRGRGHGPSAGHNSHGGFKRLAHLLGLIQGSGSFELFECRLGVHLFCARQALTGVGELLFHHLLYVGHWSSVSPLRAVQGRLASKKGPYPRIRVWVRIGAQKVVLDRWS